MYIKSVSFLNDVRCFNKGESFLFADINLLVGDQGSGKSTLLDLLSKNDRDIEVALTPRGESGVDTFFFDAEKMNPRMNDPQNYTNPNGTNCGIGYGRALLSRFKSHGEVLVGFTIDALKRAENSVIFLDEPESSLSLRNQFRLAEEIKGAAKRNCQLVVATHSLIMIQSVPQVLSLEYRKWMGSRRFINHNRR